MKMTLMTGFVTAGLMASHLLFAAVATPATSTRANPPPANAALSADNTIDSDASLTNTKIPEYVILQPSEQVVYSSEITASIANLHVKEGSYFQSGDTLLEMDCRTQTADYNKAVAQLSAASMSLKSANRLKSYEAISQYEVVKAQSEAAMAHADVAKFAAIVEKCIIKAPFNGAVAELKVHNHESVKPGDKLMKIINMEHPIVEMELPSSWLQWLRIGSTFAIHVNELNLSLPAKIIRINPEIEPVSQTVKIIGEFADTTDKLLPGMTGQASFTDYPAKLNHVARK